MLSSSLASVLIGDINGDGFDDIVRYVPSEDGNVARWDVSWRASSDWTPLASISVWQPPEEMSPADPAFHVRTFIGRFNAWNGRDLIATDRGRRGLIFSQGSAGFLRHSLYAY